MPALDTVHETTTLRDVSIATGRGEFIANALAPDFSVMKQSDKFWIWDVKGEANRIEDSVRAEGAMATFVDAEWTDDNYSTQDHSFNAAVTDEQRSNADVPIQPFVQATEVATRKLLVQEDNSLKTLIDAAMTGGTTTTPSTKWDNSGDPIKDIMTGKQKILDANQVNANVLAFSRKIMWKLWTNPIIIERIKAGGTDINPAVVNLSALAQVFDVERIAVSIAYKNTAALTDTKVMVDIWGVDAYLAFVPPSLGLKTITGAITFVWNDPNSEGSPAEMGHSVRTWRDIGRKREIIAVHKNSKQKIISATCFHKFNAAVSA